MSTKPKTQKVTTPIADVKRVPPVRTGVMNAVMESRKVRAATITMSYVLVTMVVATWINTPETLAENALWIIGMLGGGVVIGQSWVDRMAASRVKIK